jgi:peptidoglycan/xylan/chitin deacetylase (PgdA/CDA1 family)
MRPRIEWPDGKKICATFTVAFEAFTRGGHFKKAKGLEVNLVSLSHANYGGNAGIWRILEVLERNQVRATVDVNSLAVQKWPDAVKALHAAGNEIAGHGTTNDIQMTDLTPDQQRAEIRARRSASWPRRATPGPATNATTIFPMWSRSTASAW